MTIESTEFFVDKLVVHIFLQKPWGVPDERPNFTIKYDSIKDMELLPPADKLKEHHLDGCWFEDIYVHKLEKTITAAFRSYQEKCAGPNENDFMGFYLKE